MFRSSSTSSSQSSSTTKSMASILRQRKRPNLRRSSKDISGTIEEDADEIDVIETSVITAEVHANPDQFSSESSIGGDDFTPPLTKSPRKDKVKREITYDATTTQKPRRRRELSFNKENPNDAVENEILTRYLRKYHMISISYESSFSYFTNKKAFTNFY